MATKDSKDIGNRSNHAKALTVLGTVLDYLKVVMWPVVILTVIFVFKPDLKDLLARIQKVETPGGFSATLGTDRPRDVAKSLNAPDVFFSLSDNVAGSNCPDRAQDALTKSGFSQVHKGDLTYGYSDKFVGAVWCRAQNPILITVAGPQEGLSAKQAEVERRFRGEMP